MTFICASSHRAIRLMGEKVVEDKWGTNKRLVFMYDENGAPNTVYYYNNSTSATKYYYVLNLQGDVTEIRSTSNALVAQYNYDAFGNILSIKDANGANITSSTHIANVNPLRYRGYFYDSETGFYYLNSRYYDPATRRFINADSILNNGSFIGLNLYAYCNNNPVMYSDPDGDIALEAALTYTLYAVGGALVSYCAGKIAEITITHVMESPSVSVKDDARAEEKEEVKDSPDDVIIYRYGDKLYPSQDDIAHFPQTLSFTTKKPRYPGYYMTTIGAVNATGTLKAVQDGRYHVSVSPVGVGTMEDWYCGGKYHPYTQILESICVER